MTLQTNSNSDSDRLAGNKMTRKWFMPHLASGTSANLGDVDLFQRIPAIPHSLEVILTHVIN